jgi:hypothetical protein
MGQKAQTRGTEVLLILAAPLPMEARNVWGPELEPRRKTAQAICKKTARCLRKPSKPPRLHSSRR